MSIRYGTSGDDILATTGSGQTLFGLGGADRLSSRHDGSVLDGGAGDDTLSTLLGRADIGGLPVQHVAQYGGDGNDSLTIAADSPVEAIAVGGGGNDRIHVAIGLSIGLDPQSLVDISGGDGNDDIWVAADTDQWQEASRAAGPAAASSGSTAAMHATPLQALNIVHAGTGNDHVVARAGTSFAGFDNTAKNAIFGEAGNDRIESDASAYGNGGNLATNWVDGGAGADTITIGSGASSNNSDSTLRDTGIGGSGNDRVTLQQTASGDGRSTLTGTLLGGDGNDTLRADISAYALDRVKATETLDGGAGNDRLFLKLDAQLDSPTGVMPDPNVSALGLLTGGTGNDSLTATTVNAGSSATLKLDGGAGNDLLTVYGGFHNRLSGGTGDDRLAGGGGDDRLLGGGGADTFIFDLSRPSGKDTVADFAGSLDRLAFHGVTLAHGQSVAAALDALAGLTDHGAGGTVVAHFHSGAEIDFAGIGTGHIDSFADLVAHSDQLLLV